MSIQRPNRAQSQSIQQTAVVAPKPATTETFIKELEAAAKGKLTSASAYDPEIEVFSIANPKNKAVSVSTVDSLLTKWAQQHVPDGEWEEDSQKSLQEFFESPAPTDPDYDADFDITEVGKLLTENLQDLKQFRYMDDSGSNWVNVIVGKAKDGTFVGIRNPNLE